MLQLPQLRVQVKDYPFNPRGNVQSVVESKLTGDQTFYHVYIRLEGADVPLVKAVTYTFHPTVQPQHLAVAKSYDNPDCMVDLWLWGMFVMSASVVDVRGTETEISYELQFGTYFEPGKFKESKLSLRKLG